VEDDESRIDTSENCFSHRIFIRHWPRHRIPPATSRLEHDLAHLRSHGFQAIQLDVLDPSSTKDCVSSLAMRCPSGIGALVNNAGIVIPGAVEDLSREDLSKQLGGQCSWIAGTHEHDHSDTPQSEVGEDCAHQLDFWRANSTNGWWLLRIQICTRSTGECPTHGTASLGPVAPTCAAMP
jgi:hypothetical protein